MLLGEVNIPITHLAGSRTLVAAKPWSGGWVVPTTDSPQNRTWESDDLNCPKESQSAAPYPGHRDHGTHGWHPTCPSAPPA